jgi:hypothetical protein
VGADNSFEAGNPGVLKGDPVLELADTDLLVPAAGECGLGDVGMEGVP